MEKREEGEDESRDGNGAKCPSSQHEGNGDENWDDEHFEHGGYDNENWGHSFGYGWNSNGNQPEEYKSQQFNRLQEILTLEDVISLNALSKIPRSIIFERPADVVAGTEYENNNSRNCNNFISCKSNGVRYICVVYNNLHCDLISWQYMSTLKNHEILLILDCELIQLVPGSKYPILIVFDVIAKSQLPTEKKLSILDSVLWNGHCKICGYHPRDHFNLSKPSTCDNGIHEENWKKCNRCYFGLKLKHPLFNQVLIKREISFTDLKKAHISNVCEDLAVVPSRKLHDGLIIESEANNKDVLKLKWDINLTLDVWIPEYIPFTLTKNEERIGYVLERKGEYRKTIVPVVLPPSLSKKNVIVECFFRDGKWHMLRIRTDKNFPNYIYHEEKFLRVLHARCDINECILKLCAKPTNNGKEVATIPHSIANQVDLLMDIFWDKKLKESNNSFEVFEYLMRCDRGQVLIGEDFKLDRLDDLPDYYRQSFHQNHPHPLHRMFAYHNQVKSLLYVMFAGSKIVDLGPGKCSNRYQIPELFAETLFIERDQAFVADLLADKAIQNYQSERKIHIMHADGSEPGLSDRVQGSRPEFLPSHCFALFSMQGTCNTEESVRQFAKNMFSLLDEDGLLIAILPESKNLPLEGVTILDGAATDPIFQLIPTKGTNWLGGSTVTFKTPVYSEQVTECWCRDLSYRSNPLHQAVAKEGFTLARVIPLEVFHWWIRAPFAPYDMMTDQERFVSSLYRCVIWRKDPTFRRNERVSSHQTSPVPSTIMPARQSRLQTGCLLEKYWIQIFPSELIEQISDYLDIVSHIHLASSSKVWLSEYLIGHERSFYSKEMIASCRLFPPLLPNSFTYLDGPVVINHQYVGGTQTVKRVLTGSFYNPFFHFPCFGGCLFCQCQIAKDQPGKGRAAGGYRSTQEWALRSLQQSIRSPHCFCVLCYYKAHDRNKFVRHFNTRIPEIGSHLMNHSLDDTTATSTGPTYIMSFLILKSLLVGQSKESMESFISINKENKPEDVPSVSSSEALLAVALNKAPLSSLWQSNSIELCNTRRSQLLFAMQRFRRSLDELLFQPLIAIDYSLTPTIKYYPPGPPHSAFVAEPVERRDEYHMKVACTLVADIMKHHLSWRERWIALRIGNFLPEKKSLRWYGSDDSYGSESDCSPYVSCFW